MKKKPLIIEETLIWLRGCLTLTAEEKFQMLLILVICWIGLVSRFFYLRHQQPEPLTPQEVQALEPAGSRQPPGPYEEG